MVPIYFFTTDLDPQIKETTTLFNFFPTGEQHSNWKRKGIFQVDLLYWNKHALCGATETACVMKALLSLEPIGKPRAPDRFKQAALSEWNQRNGNAHGSRDSDSKTPIHQPNTLPRGVNPTSRTIQGSHTLCCYLNGVINLDFVIHHYSMLGKLLTQSLTLSTFERLMFVFTDQLSLTSHL